MRPSFTATSAHDCTLSYDCPNTGKRITRTFRVQRSAEGSYVYEGAQHAYERLAKTGKALWWKGRGPLSNVIRAEYRRMRQHVREAQHELDHV